MTYEQFIAESQRRQRQYIADEKERMNKARVLCETYAAHMGALGLHPLTITEIYQRKRELFDMLERVEETHGDSPAMRSAYNMRGITCSPPQ